LTISQTNGNKGGDILVPCKDVCLPNLYQRLLTSMRRCDHSQDCCFRAPTGWSRFENKQI